MPLFKATIWHCSSAQMCHSYEPIRYIAEFEARDEEHFKAIVRDHYLHDIDAEIDFGPISRKYKKDE